MISSVYSATVLTGNGSNDTFAIGFTFTSSSEVKVSVADPSTAALAVKTAGTHYNVSGTNVVFTTGNIPSNGAKVVIELTNDYLQSSDFVENTAFPAQAIENALDKLTKQTQILSEMLGRAIKVSVLDADDAPDLGTMATQDADSVAITGGTIAGITDLAVADGGSGASTAAGARTNLGLGSMATQSSSAVSITGGSIAASTLDITSLTEDTTPDNAADFTLTYDASASANKKVKLVNLISASTNLIDDTLPKLGGDLDTNSNSILFSSGSANDCSDDTTLALNSSTILVTQHAAKTYIDTQIANAKISQAMFARAVSVTAGTTVYATISLSSTTETSAGRIYFPGAGVIDDLYVQAASAPGAGKSYVTTVRVNGSDSTLTATIADSDTTASSTSTNVNVSAGNYYSVKIVSSGGATSGQNFTVSFRWTPA